MFVFDERDKKLLYVIRSAANELNTISWADCEATYNRMATSPKPQDILKAVYEALDINEMEEETCNLKWAAIREEVKEGLSDKQELPLTDTYTHRGPESRCENASPSFVQTQPLSPTEVSGKRLGNSSEDAGTGSPLTLTASECAVATNIDDAYINNNSGSMGIFPASMPHSPGATYFLIDDNTTQNVEMREPTGASTWSFWEDVQEYISGDLPWDFPLLGDFEMRFDAVYNAGSYELLPIEDSCVSMDPEPRA